MTIRALLTDVTKKAELANKEATAIKLLLQHVTKKEGYEILADLNTELSDDEIEAFNRLASSYIDDGIPVQHLIGYETFFGYQFKVNPDVLIPRFETEELVEKVLAIYDEYFPGNKVDVVDVGCGCGAIGIALALEESNMSVTLTDISAKALVVARENAGALGADVQLLQSDMLVGLVAQKKRFDILVSNPPYIPTSEVVDPLVYDHEPHLALFGGADGLYFYEQILKDAAEILKPRNVIAFEHAFHHREPMAKLIQTYFPEATFETIKDMQGKDRITVIVND